MTTHRRLHALALALGLCLATAASAQTVRYNIRTGDVWADNRLGEINDYGRYNRDPFIDEIHGSSSAPRPLLVDLLDRRAWAPRSEARREGQEWVSRGRSRWVP